VTLRWKKNVMTVFINDVEVGSVRTDSTPEHRSPVHAHPHPHHHMRFCVQFWKEHDQVTLMSYDGVLASCESTPRDRRATDAHHRHPASPDKRKLSKNAKNRSASAATAAAAAARGAERSEGEAADAATGSAAHKTAPGEEGAERSSFRWGCCFECKCPKRASWNKNEGFQAPPAYSDCGCAACAATSVLRARAPPRPPAPRITAWPRRVSSPPPAPDISRLLRASSSASHRSSVSGGGKRALAVRSSGYGKSRAASPFSADSSRSSSMSSTGCSVGDGRLHHRQRGKQGKPFVEYLGVRYKIDSFVLEGTGEGAVLARALETNSRVLLQDAL